MEIQDILGIKPIGEAGLEATKAAIKRALCHDCMNKVEREQSRLS